MIRHRRQLASLITAALLAGACSGDDTDEVLPSVPGTQASTPSSPTDPGITTATVETESPTTANDQVNTSATTDTTATSAPVTAAAETTTTLPTRRLPEELGPQVPALDFDDLPDALRQPGEFIQVFDNTLVYIPAETDVDDLNNQRPDDEDLPIIAAYAEAVGAISSQVSQFPVAIEPNQRVQDAFLDQGEAFSQGTFTRRSETGTYVGFPFDRPTIYRPYVVDAPRTEDSAIVFDCQLISGVVSNDLDEVQVDDAQAFATSGVQASVVKLDGLWIVDEIITQDAACLA